MGLNAVQSEFLSNVRSGTIEESEVCRQLGAGVSTKYVEPSFRELLFAIESLNRFRSDAWQAVFIGGLEDHYRASGSIDNNEIVEVEEWVTRYGVGSNALHLLVDLMEDLPGLRSRLRSLVKKTMRLMYDGTRGVSRYDSFVLKKWIEKRSEQKSYVLQRDDVEEILRIDRETQGLEKDPTFLRKVATVVTSHLLYGNETGPSTRDFDWLADQMELAGEVGPEELGILKMLERNCGALPGRLNELMIEEPATLFG